MNCNLSIMSKNILCVSLNLILCLFFFTSCGPLSGLFSDEEEELVMVAETPEVEEEPVIEVAEIPSWHDPNHPVQVTSDSVVITGTAVSSVSADARSIAEIAVNEHKKTAFTNLIYTILEDKGSDALSSEAGSRADGQSEQDVIKMLTLEDDELFASIPFTVETFYFETNGQVRCYIRHAYEKAALSREIRDAIEQ